MIIICVIMLVLSFKQSADIRGLQREIETKKAWIEKNFSNADHEFFQDLQKRADTELKKQALQPVFFSALFLQIPWEGWILGLYQAKVPRKRGPPQIPPTFKFLNFKLLNF